MLICFPATFRYARKFSKFLKFVWRTNTQKVSKVVKCEMWNTWVSLSLSFSAQNNNLVRVTLREVNVLASEERASKRVIWLNGRRSDNYVGTNARQYQRIAIQVGFLRVFARRSRECELHSRNQQIPHKSNSFPETMLVFEFLFVYGNVQHRSNVQR